MSTTIPDECKEVRQQSLQWLSEMCNILAGNAEDEDIV